MDLFTLFLLCDFNENPPSTSIRNRIVSLSSLYIGSCSWYTRFQRHVVVYRLSRQSHHTSLWSGEITFNVIKNHLVRSDTIVILHSPWSAAATDFSWTRSNTKFDKPYTWWSNRSGTRTSFYHPHRNNDNDNKTSDNFFSCGV